MAVPSASARTDNVPEPTETNITDSGITVESGSDSDEVDSEETSEDEGDSPSRKPAQTLSCVPNEVIASANKPSFFGSVAVTNSTEVHFGNKTVINGPVTIKKLVSSGLGFDNNGFLKTEEDTADKAVNGDAKSNRSPENVQTNRFLRPHYIVMGLVGIGVMASITTLVTIFLEKSQNDDLKSTALPELDAKLQIFMMKATCTDASSLLVLLIGIIAIVLVSILIVVVLTKNHSSEADDLKPVPNVRPASSELLPASRLRYVTRTQWVAQPVVAPLDPLPLPARWVIIAHTATDSCSIQSECVLVVRNIQMFHVESNKWYDIGYNFLVGGDGSAYIGRGWDSAGAHTKYYNSRSIGIAFIGTFNNVDPLRRQVAACRQLIEDGVALGKIAKDYKLFGHRQLMSTLSPGDRVYSIMQQWPHFAQNNTDDD